MSTLVRPERIPVNDVIVFRCEPRDSAVAHETAMRIACETGRSVVILRHGLDDIQGLDEHEMAQAGWIRDDRIIQLNERLADLTRENNELRGALKRAVAGQSVDIGVLRPTT